MEVSGATDVGVQDRRAVRGPMRLPAIEVVSEDGGDGGIGAGTDLECPLAGRLEALVTMVLGEPENADAGAKALLRVPALAHDDVDQGLRVGADAGGLAADTLRRPGGVTAMRARHVFRPFQER